MDEVEITEQQKKQDAYVRMGKANTKRLARKAHEDAINKLPNEFRERERGWNPHNLYHGDSYCQLYGEEND